MAADHLPLLSRLDLGNEAGDDVSFDELSKYFYEQPAFGTFSSEQNRLAVATAKKGVGKSALLRWLSGRLAETFPNDVIIRCRGADLSRDRFQLPAQRPSVPNDRIREWMVRLCTLANRTIAQRIGFAFSDDKIGLVESAEIEGFKQRNLVGCLLERFGRMLPTKGPEKKRIVEEVEALKRQTGTKLWLLVDDLDATFQNTSDELLELSTCFSAFRYLIQDVEGISFRATLRTDVWPLIRRYDESLDKLEQYISELEWSRDDFRGLLFKRIRAQLIDLQLPLLPESASQHEYISLVLEDYMEWAQKQVPNYQVIYTLSYQRPRWGIQLCKLAQHPGQSHVIRR